MLIRALTTAGWISLLIGLLCPFVVSVSAMVWLWRWRCTDDILWGSAPLLISCGEPSGWGLVAGWTGTIVTFLSLVGATGVAVYLLLTRRTGAAPGPQRRSVRCYAITICAVIAGVSVVLVANPDQTWGTSSWIYFGSSACLGIYAAATICCAVFGRRVAGADVTQRGTLPRAAGS